MTYIWANTMSDNTYAEHRQPFDEIKHRHTLNEVGDVAEGRYDWKIERGRGGINL